jgi:hypothetical protein
MTKLIVAFCNFSIASKTHSLEINSKQGSFWDMEETNFSGKTYISAVARILGTPMRGTHSLENKTQRSIVALLLGILGKQNILFLKI